MSKTLVIVESPAKCHKIQEYLGVNYIVAASIGHITELAKGGKHGIGVDIENKFKPHYVISDDKIDVVDNLMKLAKECSLILLAMDDDREGASIAWHVMTRLTDVGTPFKRVVFNEIKKSVILKAIQNPTDIDMRIVHAQEARRILDRLVGFTASPFLMNFFGDHLSAGRVQSVVTRLVVDREQEIKNFIPETFWTIQVKLNNGKDSFITKYVGKISDQITANKIKTTLNSINYTISDVVALEEKKFPQAPLVTSTLQRIMSKQHNLSVDRTMKAAQTLYESGYCTYIRTDSIRVGDEALTDVRQWISDKKYELPKKAYIYKNKEAAQDAHECIRPSDITLLPWDNYAIIDPDEKLVYETIWKHFVASQMMPAVYNTLAVTANPTNSVDTKVKATGKALKIKGYLEVLGVIDDSSIDIPNLIVWQIVQLDLNKGAIKLEKKQTQPPPRYSEDKQIKELVNKNIGRPSTFADLLNKVATRDYVEKIGSVYHAKPLGNTITDVLVKNFTFMDYNFTSNLEKLLDDIAEGKIDYIDVLSKFWASYSNELYKAYSVYDTSKIICDKCQNVMVKRTGKFGNFYSCVNPSCKTILNQNLQGQA